MDDEADLREQHQRKRDGDRKKSGIAQRPRADLRRPLRMLQNLNAGKPMVFAYCFCEVR